MVIFKAALWVISGILWFSTPLVCQVDEGSCMTVLCSADSLISFNADGMQCTL